MSKYRVGVIGTGGIARHHAGYYVADERTEIVAGADINPEHLDRYCEEFSVPGRYADHRELLEKEKLDIVSVCTWQESHPELTIAAAEAGVKGIICEKPIGIDLAGPRAMIQACEDRAVTLVIHHQTRCMPTFVAAKQAIAEGMIGEPIQATCTLTGGLLNIGSHSIDISRYLMGDPRCEWVLGQTQRKTNRYERGSVCEDMCQAFIGLSNGARIVIDLDLPDTETKVTRLVLGTEGRIVTDGESARVLCSDAQGWQTLLTEPQPSFLEEFLAEMEGGPEHRCAPKHALAAHEVMMAMYESARTRSLVELPFERGGSALEEMAAPGGPMDCSDQEPYDIRIEAALKYYLDLE